MFLNLQWSSGPRHLPMWIRWEKSKLWSREAVPPARRCNGPKVLPWLYKLLQKRQVSCGVSRTFVLYNDEGASFVGMSNYGQVYGEIQPGHTQRTCRSLWRSRVRNTIEPSSSWSDTWSQIYRETESNKHRIFNLYFGQNGFLSQEWTRLPVDLASYIFLPDQSRKAV